MDNINPQRENGHLEIASEIVDQLIQLHLSGNEWQVIWVVLRKTWGWNKKQDQISLTQFEKLTKLSRPAINIAIKKLVAKKLLLVKKILLTNSYSFNKLYNIWTSSEKRTSSFFNTKLVAITLPKLVAKTLHTIDNINTIQYTEIISYFNNVMKTDFKVLSDKNLSYWLKTYSVEEIKKAIKKIPSDNFWKEKMTPTILFRRKNPRGEDVDYIGGLLNSKEKINNDISYKLLKKV